MSFKNAIECFSFSLLTAEKPLIVVKVLNEQL